MSSARVQRACIRCRKQKLKCDNERPCALCTRSGAECEENPPRSKRSTKTKAHGFPHPSRRDQGSAYGSLRGRPGSSSHSAIYDAFQAPTPRPPALPVADGWKQQARKSMVLQERKSTYGLVDQVFKNHHLHSESSQSADAIPDGNLGRDASSRTQERLIPASQLIGMDLPSRPIVNFLFNNFLDSVHWFMMVFHEPTLRAEIDEMVTFGHVPGRRLSFLVLVMLILAIGARYATESDTEEYCSTLELASLRSKLMAKVEKKFLDIFDEGDIESVQISILLASYYLYHRRPKRAFAVIGAGLKSAQALGLHQEPSWGQINSVTREVRRRVWWALFVADGFMALCYGKSSSIQENEWQVGMVDDIDDVSTKCPGFDSTELREDGTYQRVTIVSYQRHKFNLYRIASPITRTIYFHRGATMREVVGRVKEINQRLIEWDRSLPPELRLKSFAVEVDEPILDPTLKTFRLQALALQLSYDNIQLLLHRPLLTYTGSLYSPRLSENLAEEAVQDSLAHASRTDVPTFVVDDDLSQSCRSQCWQSAIRTSWIGDYPSILRTASNTHAAAYVGIQSFTAAAVLAIFALTDPLSNQAHDAKRAIARLIGAPRTVGFRTHVSDQCGSILEGLLRLILAEEMKSLILIGGTSHGETFSNSNAMSQQALSTASQVCTPVPQASRSVNRWSHPTQERPENHPTNLSESLTRATSSHYHHPSSIPQQQATDEEGVYLTSSRATPYPDVYPVTATGNFAEAQMSLQHVFRSNGIAFSEDLGLSQQCGESDQVHGQIYGDGRDFMLAQEPLAGCFQGDGLSDAFNENGQSWIWDPSIRFE